MFGGCGGVGVVDGVYDFLKLEALERLLVFVPYQVSYYFAGCNTGQSILL